MSDDALGAHLRGLADRVAGATDDHPVALRVELPDGSVAEAAAGRARPEGPPMTCDRPFHVASIGKAMTASVVLRLAEQGAFGPRGVDARLGDLDVLAPSVLDRLSVRDHEVLGPSITLRQLLTHTSGLKDTQLDDASGTEAELGRPAPGSLIASFWRGARAAAAGDDDGAAPARHRWVGWDPSRPDDPRAGVLNHFLAGGAAATPVGRPGDRFHYSDTGYVLLAVVAEERGGRPFHELVRAEVLEPLGLAATWTAYVEPPPPGVPRPEAEVWLGGIPLLATGLDLSSDWGGGGQVSTVADLTAFLGAVLGGRLFADPATSGAVTDWMTPAGLAPPRTGIGLGLQRWALPDGSTVVGHAGAWGGRLFADPATGAVIAGTADRDTGGAWLTEIVTFLHQRLGVPA